MIKELSARCAGRADTVLLAVALCRLRILRHLRGSVRSEDLLSFLRSCECDQVVDRCDVFLHLPDQGLCRSPLSRCSGSLQVCLPSAFSSGQQDGAAIIFSTSDLISCFVIIYLLAWISLSEFHVFLSLRDLTGRKSKTPSSRISAPAVTLIITLIDPAFITPKHVDSCSKTATSSASAKQPHPRLQQSRHARGFSKAATPAAVTSCRHVNRKHESGCEGERPGEAFNQPDLT